MDLDDLIEVELTEPGPRVETVIAGVGIEIVQVEQDPAAGLAVSQFRNCGSVISWSGTSMK